ncbi:hypothetical protein D3C73_733690 [compost metagenome]
MIKGAEREVLELHMLTSLARSQRALSRIIESVADQVEASEALAGKVLENMEIISTYQRVLIRKITGFQPRKTTSSRTPAPPWLHTGQPGLLRPRSVV